MMSELKDNNCGISSPNTKPVENMSLDTSYTSQKSPLNDSENTPMDVSCESPSKSRYGRSHKPKAQGDFVTHDRKISAYLKVSPVNQIQSFRDNVQKEKKKGRPRKSDSDSASKLKELSRRSFTGNISLSPENALRSTSNANTPPAENECPPQVGPVPGCEWMVGDLAWARVGGHPYWPCVIAVDPELNIFTKTSVKGRNAIVQRHLHVQFFGDNGRRSWLNTSSVINFCGLTAFNKMGEAILSTMKKKEPKLVSAFVVKPSVIQVWEKAVQEAEDLINKTREERTEYFRRLYPPVQQRPPTRKELLAAAMADSPPRKHPQARKRKADTSIEIPVPIKQLKTEHVEEEKKVKVEENRENVVTPLQTSTPRTIADRKKRQAMLLMEFNRSQQQASPVQQSPVKKLKEDEPEKEEKQLRDRTRLSKENEINEKPEKPEIKKRPKRKIKKKSKFGPDFVVFSTKHFDRVSDEHPELKEKEVDRYLEKMWLEMDDVQKARYRSRFVGQETMASESESTEEDEIESTGPSENDDEQRSEKSGSQTPPPVMPISRAGMSKRAISLFIGAKNEKACQICEKPGDTIRCRGPCNGYYHLDCLNKPKDTHAEEEVNTPSKKGRKKKFRPDSKSTKQKGRPSKYAKVETTDGEDSGILDVTSELDETKSEITSEKMETEKLCEEGTAKNTNIEGKTNKLTTEEKTVAAEEKTIANEDKIKSIIDTDEDKMSEVSSEVSNEKDELTKSEEISSDAKGEGDEDKVSEKKKARKGSKDSSESASSEEGEGFKCPNCLEGKSPPCFVCNSYVEKKTNSDKLHRCHTARCGKEYHMECLKAWPQTSWTSGQSRRNNGKTNEEDERVMTCPQHTCHTCVSDNPAVVKARFTNDRLVRCLRCPTSYHYGNYCIPAGSEIVSTSQIICPRHYKPLKKGNYHVNAAWCFICATGGSLICCDLCPTSFHADCLKISPPDGSYVCEDCQTGRFPLYGEIVWVKLGAYRWWPAEILFPAQIPDNIMNLPHTRGEFAVRFFGSHDHYWVNRGRVFLYQEGDSGKGSSKKSSVDSVFLKAIEEATEAQEKLKVEKAVREAETRPGLKPPTYVKLKTNKPVGNVRTMEVNVSNMTPCECDPNSKNPCALDSDCLNRILMVECNPHVCPAGERCNNQLFEKRQYPPLMPYKTEGRGWGLKTLVPIKKGDFVIEYVGEMIDEAEYKRRLSRMHKNKDENYYFLTIDKDRMLDAGPKGNVARFMNHSCQPNCETQKWTVNGDTRVGLFALCDIPADAELVFNYNLESIGNDMKPCMCGAPNCSGYIGVKVNKQGSEEEKKPKVLKKKTKTPAKVTDEECFVCGNGGELLLCDNKSCTKGYHLSCLNKTKWPQGYWVCPWHQCTICNKGRVQRCTFCVNSYCQDHAEGNIRLDPERGLVCKKHDTETNTDESTNKNEDKVIRVSGTLNDKQAEVDSSAKENCVEENKTDVTTENEKEKTNNNISETPSNLPERRTRRSKSYNGIKSSNDVVVNGVSDSAEKDQSVKRRNRPSSVDSALLTSSKKLKEMNGTENDKETTEALATNIEEKESLGSIIAKTEGNISEEKSIQKEENKELKKYDENVTIEKVAENEEVKEEEKMTIVEDVGENSVDTVEHKKCESYNKEETAQDEKGETIVLDERDSVVIDEGSNISKEKEEDSKRKDITVAEVSNDLDSKKKDIIVEELSENAEVNDKEEEEIKSSEVVIEIVEGEGNADTEKENIDINTKEKIDEGINENKTDSMINENKTDTPGVKISDEETASKLQVEDKMVCDDVVDGKNESQAVAETIPESEVTDKLDFFAEDVSVQDELIDKMDISMQDSYIEKVNLGDNISDSEVKGTVDSPMSNKIIDNRDNKVDDSIKNGCVSTQ